MKAMDILEALRSVDEGLLTRSEHPIEQRRGWRNGVKIAVAAALLLLVGLGGFWLLRRGAHVASQPPEYTLPALETQAPPVSETQTPTVQVQTPITYSANWEALQNTWRRESDLLAVQNGIHTTHDVTYYGDVPEEYRDLIRHNAFSGAEVCGDRLINAFSGNGRVCVAVYDRYGKELARCERTCDNDHYVAGMTASSDRGFLFALGYWDNRIPASESDVFSQVIKCGADGSVLWTRELDGFTCDMLKYCFETDDGYCFFGTQEQLGGDPDAALRDVCLLCLNADGSTREHTVLEGSKDDRLIYAAQTHDGFALGVDTQSSDGIYPAAGTCLVNIDRDLNVLHVRAEEWAGEYFEASTRLLGIVDDRLLMSNAQGLPEADFPYGNLRTVVDWGNQLLTVSEYLREAEVQPPERDSILYESGTVYAAFDKKNGTLLWRAVTTAEPNNLTTPDDAAILLWDEAELPLDWLVKAPEPGEESSPEEKESLVLAMKELFRQEALSLLELKREELESVAKDMLRLHTQSADPKTTQTYFFNSPSVGLVYDHSAQTDVDTAALTERLRTLKWFDSVIINASHGFVDDDMCIFEMTSGDGAYTFHNSLCYCANPHPERPLYDSEVSEMFWLDDHWYFLFQAARED